MDSRVAEKAFCGLPLRKACVVVGVLNLIVAVILGIGAITLFRIPILLVVPITAIEILLVTVMTVGAIKQNVRLMLPYFVVKLTLLIGSAVTSAGCLIVFCVIMLQAQMGKYKGSGMGFYWLYSMIILLGVVCFTFFALNVIPVLVVRKYLRDLKETPTKEASGGKELEDARTMYPLIASTK